MSKQYEYTQVSVPSTGRRAVPQLEKLNEMSSDGWEVFGNGVVGMNARDYTVVYSLRRAVKE